MSPRTIGCFVFVACMSVGCAAAPSVAPTGDGGPRRCDGGSCGPTLGEDAARCEPLRCADDETLCGTVEDGCGGTIRCPRCGTCVPASCEDLAATCGEREDGCGGTLNCGPPCDPVEPCTDSAEPNPADSPRMLEGLDDFDENTVERAGLKIDVAAGDEDWFVAEVNDSNLDPLSPVVRVVADTQGATALEIAVYYRCAEGVSEPTCDRGTPIHDAIGVGCSGPGGGEGILLAPECDGEFSDDGTVIVVVRDDGSAEACATYDLSVQAY